MASVATHESTAMSMSMAQRMATQKENQALTDLSLLNLGKLISISNSKWQLFMRLCIPTTTIIQHTVNAQEMDHGEVNLVQKLLLHWKRLNVMADDDTKIAILVVGLRTSGFVDIAEKVYERYTSNSEITPDLIG